MSRNNFEKIRQGSELLLLALVMLCSSSLNANAQQSTRLNLEVRIVQTSKEQIKAEIGRFIVPENYRRPSGKQITLAFIRFGATTRNPGPPILYLAGGPGTSGIEYATGRRFESYLGLRQFGDIIALDQRGTGLSQPSLNCPRKFFYPLDRAATRQSLARAYRSFARTCSQYWKRKGVDLAAYNTEASADDVKALSDIMGVKQFRLFAASYGTHLGLSIIRRHPDLVERAVFGGIEGPDQTIKLPLDVETHLAKVSNMIAADPFAGKLLPDFRGLLAKLTVQLSRKPVKLKVKSANGLDKPIEVRLSAIDVELIAASLLGRRSTIETIPKIFAPATQGNYSAIASYLPEIRGGEISAMGAAMDCASSASVKRRQIINAQASGTFLGTLLDFPLPEWCNAWGVPQLPSTFRAPLRSTVPVLFIAGTIDGQTPLSNAQEIRRGFPNGALFTVENAGHDPSMFMSSPRLIDSINDFIAGKRTSDATFKALPLRFVLPGSSQ